MRIDVVARCGREILANVLMGIPVIARARTKLGRTSAPASPDQVRRYAFDLILENPRIQALIPGAHVLEIGPGDHLATGLSLVAYGAASYTALDRFPGDYAGASASQWYALVRNEWTQHFSSPWPEHLDGFPDLPCVHQIRSAIEDVEALPENKFDLIVSQAVGEHVQSIDAFAASTYKMLKPGGTAMHNIDFSCHGFFADAPLLFLTIPQPVWRLMGSNRGLPNRHRASDFEAAFSKSRFSSMQIDAHKIVASIPESLAHLPKASVLTNWASFILRK